MGYSYAILLLSEKTSSFPPYPTVLASFWRDVSVKLLYLKRQPREVFLPKS